MTAPAMCPLSTAFSVHTVAVKYRSIQIQETNESTKTSRHHRMKLDAAAEAANVPSVTQQTS